MKNILKASATAATLALLAACSNGSSAVVLSPAGNTQSGQATQYTQIERLSRPAVKEVFEPFQDHQKSNAVEPYNDPTIQADIVATEDTLRPVNTSVTPNTDYGKALAGVLYPDEYLVNLTGAAPSGADPYYFLSSDLSNGAAFGGRAPNDDVINLELGALFGNTLSALGLIGDDKEENNCLSSQNIGGQGVQAAQDPSKKSTNTFPYLANPH